MIQVLEDYLVTGNFSNFEEMSFLISFLLSFSRDTTIRIWNLSDFSEQRSLGGHTSAVTCVKILPEKDDFSSRVSLEDRS